jgi:hypothetical protein
MATVVPDGVDETTKSVFLMKEESGLLGMPSSILNITTATFFKGKVPTEDLKRRITELVQANPWLACRLKKEVDPSDKKKKPAMVFDTQPKREAIVADHYKEYSEADVQGDKKLKLSTIDISQPYQAICKAVGKTAGVHCTGSKCLGKNAPQFRVTVVPSADGGRFALLVSISHVIADGYTYYEILNLLSLNAPMKVLDPVRKSGFTESLKTALGKKEYNFPCCAGYLFNAIGNMMFGSKPKVRAHFIDKGKVAAAKAKEAGGSVPFVSTNDIVTSAFGKLTRTNVLEMAINMRDRLPSYTMADAGNLEWALYFRPKDFATPSLIRQSITTKDGKLGRCCAGSNTKLPGFWGAARKRIAIITNWSSNHTGECVLGNGCTQELHLPIYTMAPLEFGIVFKPTPDTLGLMTWSRHIKKGDFQQGGQGDGVFGELVSDRVFSS